MKVDRTNFNFINDEAALKRLVRAVSAILIIVTIGFSAYYYWDRYVHPGDKSPAEMGVDHMRVIVDENPQDPQTRLALAQYQFQTGEYDQAIEQAQVILSAYPDEPGAFFVIGLANVRKGDFEAAVKPLERFVALRREISIPEVDKLLQTGLYYLGESYLQIGQPDLAISALKEALSIDGTDADAMVQLGLAFSQAGEMDAAIEQYQNAVRFVPDFIEAYQGMATSYAALGQNDLMAYAQGMAAYSAEDYEEARLQLEQVVAGLPEFAPALLGLGLTYERLGEFEAAAQYLTKVLALDPHNFAANNALEKLQSMGYGS